MIRTLGMFLDVNDRAANGANAGNPARVAEPAMATPAPINPMRLMMR